MSTYFQLPKYVRSSVSMSSDIQKYRRRELATESDPGRKASMILKLPPRTDMGKQAQDGPVKVFNYG